MLNNYFCKRGYNNSVFDIPSMGQKENFLSFQTTNKHLSQLLFLLLIPFLLFISQINSLRAMENDRVEKVEKKKKRESSSESSHEISSKKRKVEKEDAVQNNELQGLDETAREKAKIAKGGSENAPIALKELERLANEENNPAAQYNLGCIYLTGLGVKKDLKKAVKLFEEAGKQQYSNAILKLKELAKIENDDALESLGRLFKPVAWFQNEVEKGNVEATYLLGAIYTGEDVREKIANLLKQAAKDGDDGASEAFQTLKIDTSKRNSQLNREFSSMEVFGEAINLGKAEKLYKYAASKGNKDAQYALGCMYANSLGVAENLKEAAIWLQKAAWNGHKCAFVKFEAIVVQTKEPIRQFRLGEMYKTGRGVAINLELAAYWFRKSGNQGHQKAQYELGCMYANGQGVNKDLKEAEKWLEEPAWNGHEDAFLKFEEIVMETQNPIRQFNLGIMYALCQSDIEDLEEAQKWFEKSKNQDCDGAREEYDKVSRKLKEYQFLSKKRSRAGNPPLRRAFMEMLPNATGEYSALRMKRKNPEQIYSDSDLDLEEASADEIDFINTKAKNNDQLDLEKSKGFYALYRGHHYIKNLFTDENKIKENLQNMDIGIPLLSSAGYTLAGKEFLSPIASRDVKKYGDIIRTILKAFKRQSEEMYNKFHETYTNNHIDFHCFLGDSTVIKDVQKKEAFQIYRKIFCQEAKKAGVLEHWKDAVLRNPFVSFSATPRHAVKYAVGDKSYTGGKNVILTPDYQDGIPQNRYLGKTYVALFQPRDIKDLDPTFIIDRHAQGDIDVTNNYHNDILSEHEISFLGYLPKGYIKFSKPIEAPDFSEPNWSEEVSIMGKKSYERWYNFSDKERNAEKTTDKLVKIVIEKESETLESKAKEMIEENLEGKVVYFDTISKFVTRQANFGEKKIVSTALHAVSKGQKNIAFNPCSGQPKITKEGMSSFITGLTENPPLTLRFSYLNLLDASFGDLMNNQHKVVSLSLFYCGLMKADVLNIAEGLSKNKILKTLILDGNTVEDEGAERFCTVLKINTTLERLSLNTTSITKVKCFSNLFLVGKKGNINNTLTELNLEGNNIQDDEKMELRRQIRRGLDKNWEHSENIH